jgi:hypothetical protein
MFVFRNDKRYYNYVAFIFFYDLQLSLDRRFAFGFGKDLKKVIIDGRLFLHQLFPFDVLR